MFRSDIIIKKTILPITLANKKSNFFLWVYELLANSEPILSPKYDDVLSFQILSNVFENF